MKQTLLFLALVMVLLAEASAYAQGSQGRQQRPGVVDQKRPAQQSSTHLDFDSTMVDGQMKAPSGFFLQGRNRQDLHSMVQLRSTFREELKDSRSAVKGMIR